MYAPHTISLICFHNDTPHLAILRGVMLQALNGRSVQRRGDQDEANATLYIPFSVHAQNAAGEALSFLPPLAYARCDDPDRHWTLQPEGLSAGRAGFFIPGELSEPCSLAEARERYDFAYVIAGYNVHNYGSPSLRHYEVVSRVSSRYYQYGN